MFGNKIKKDQAKFNLEVMGYGTGKRAVRRFQKEHGIIQSGSLDPITLQMINMEFGNTNKE